MCYLLFHHHFLALFPPSSYFYFHVVCISPRLCYPPLVFNFTPVLLHSPILALYIHMLLVAQFLTQALSYRHIAYSLVSSCFVFRAWGVARRFVYITVLFGSLASCSQHRTFADKFCLIWPLGLAFASSYDIASLTWQVWLTCLACCSCYQGFGYAFVFVITLNLLACCSCHRGFADASVFVTTLNLFSMLLLLLELCRCVYYLL